MLHLILAASTEASTAAVHIDWLGVIRGLAAMGSICLLYTSPSPRDATLSRMPSSA